MKVDPLIKVFSRRTGEQIGVFDGNTFKDFSFILDMEGGCKECAFELLENPQNYLDGFDQILIQIDPDLPPQYLGELLVAPVSNVNHYRAPESVMFEDLYRWWGMGIVPPGWNWVVTGGGTTPPIPSAIASVYGWFAGFKSPPKPAFVPSGYTFGVNALVRVYGWTGLNSSGDWVKVTRPFVPAIPYTDMTDMEIEAWVFGFAPATSARWGKMEFRLMDWSGNYIAKDFGYNYDDVLYSTSNLDCFPVWVSMQDYDYMSGPFDVTQCLYVEFYFERGASVNPTSDFYFDYIHYYPDSFSYPDKIKYLSDKKYEGYGLVGKTGDRIYDAFFAVDTPPETVFDDAATTLEDVDDVETDPTGQEDRFYFPGTGLDQALRTIVEMSGQAYWNIGQNQDILYKDIPRVLAELRIQSEEPEYYWVYGEHFSKIQDGKLIFSDLGNEIRLRTGRQVRTGTNYATTRVYRQSAAIMGTRTKGGQLAGSDDLIPTKLANSAWNLARRRAWPTYTIPSLNLLYTDEFVWPGKLVRLNIDGDEIDVRIKLVKYSYSAAKGLNINVVFGEAIRGDPLIDQLRASWVSLKEAQELIERNV